MPNNRPDDLALELLDMEFSGLTPLTAGTQAFNDAVSGGGHFLWAVDSGSNLHIIQAQPGMHHPVLTGGGEVYGAGQVVFEPGRNLVSMIDNMTGHFTPTPEISANFLQQGVAAFENAGVRVRFDGITDYGGRSPA
ncbi:hypothetical protein E1265_14795 [Streptomyces sp. 8K308]|uniref:hypothetical protein n=1 Tax=Streptomyces sp. 8K308 TaxID=2530388 RepID=UPI001046CE68|nr:hypothetical protein [Streptomyces sp. 8K308]TDC22761.1 hypothetical protein E1265_14795 [Streptomyces sp. 8K308]